jgi:hypothetical protein
MVVFYWAFIGLEGPAFWVRVNLFSAWGGLATSLEQSFFMGYTASVFGAFGID